MERTSERSERTKAYEDTPMKVYGVLIALAVGYFGKYFCTSNMYVAKAMFQDKEDIDDSQMAIFFSVGYFFSMFGKASAGALSDTYGGYPVVMISACGYIVCTLLFSFVPSGSMSFYLFLFLWAWIGYFALGLAWVAVVAVATNWIPVSHLGRLMSIMSMAPQLGDVLARLFLANLLGYGWRTVFQAASASGFILLLPVILLVRNNPGSHEDTHQFAANEEKAKGGGESQTYCQKLTPLLKTPLFWILCLLSGSLYGTRTLFLLYSNNFLTASYCYEKHADNTTAYDACLDGHEAAKVTAFASSIYTMLGCVSVLIVGVLKDMLPKRHRAATLVLFIIPLLGAMVFLGAAGAKIPFWLAVAMVAITGFSLFGPYKVLGAVFAVDVGGKKLKSTCTAFMGVFDNFFAILMLQAKGVIGDNWTTMFAAVAGLSAISLLCASYVWIKDLMAEKPKEADKPLVDKVEKNAGIERRESFEENKEQQ